MSQQLECQEEMEFTLFVRTKSISEFAMIPFCIQQFCNLHRSQTVIVVSVIQPIV